jgi:hypothetical protein
LPTGWNCGGTQDKMSKPKGVISQSGQRVVELLSHPEMVLPNRSECMHG